MTTAQQSSHNFRALAQRKSSLIHLISTPPSSKLSPRLLLFSMVQLVLAVFTSGSEKRNYIISSHRLCFKLCVCDCGCGGGREWGKRLSLNIRYEYYISFDVNVIKARWKIITMFHRQDVAHHRHSTEFVRICVGRLCQLYSSSHMNNTRTHTNTHTGMIVAWIIIIMACYSNEIMIIL